MANGWEMFVGDMAYKFGQMVQNMKVNGRMAKQMVEVYLKIFR